MFTYDSIPGQLQYDTSQAVSRSNLTGTPFWAAITIPVLMHMPLTKHIHSEFFKNKPLETFYFCNVRFFIVDAPECGWAFHFK